MNTNTQNSSGSEAIVRELTNAYQAVAMHVQSARAEERQFNDIESSIIDAYLTIESQIRRKGMLHGVNFSHAWFDALVAGNNKGMSIEVELHDLNDAQMAVYHAISDLPGVRLVFNSELGGQDKAKAITDGEQTDAFIIMKQESIAERVESLLLPKLEDAYPGSVMEQDGSLWWTVAEYSNPMVLVERKGSDGGLVLNPGIKLRDINGVWTKPAQAASTFINSVNASIQHITVNPMNHIHEQDQVWELVQALELHAEQYHELFLAPDAQVADIKKVIKYKIDQAQQKVAMQGVRSVEAPKHMFWSSFDSVEYVTRNYGEVILAEDKMIIDSVINALTNTKFALIDQSLESFADIGAGPNLYASMLFAPYLNPNAQVVLSDYSPQNLAYLSWELGEHVESKHSQLEGVWEKFEVYMTEQGGEHYAGALETIRNSARSEFVDVRELENGLYGAATSFFVTESMTEDLPEFAYATRKVVYAVKPGGICVLTHMLGSGEYPAGDDTNFPATVLTLADLQSYYETLLGSDEHFEIYEATDENEKAREGYHGMATVVVQVPDNMSSAKDMTQWALSFKKKNVAI